MFVGSLSPLVVLLWTLNVGVDAAGQLAFKAAAIDPALKRHASHWRGMARRPWVWVGLACYVIEFVLWLAFLSLVPLSQGVLLAAISTVVIMVAGRIWFKEALTPLRICGLVLITAGVTIVGLA